MCIRDSKEALTAAGVCHVGDVLGVVQGEFAIIGSDLYDVAGQVVQALVGDDGELLTVISGDDAPADLASAVVAAARIRRRDLEAVSYTHLDVYKRQVRDVVTEARSLAANVASGCHGSLLML